MTKRIENPIRQRLTTQGFDVEALPMEVTPWLRWSTSFCAGFTLLGTVLESAPLLWALAATALLGVVLPFHPFDVLYNYGVRHLTATPRLPSNPPPRRFACAVGTVWLVATGAAFHWGHTTLGVVLGLALVAVAGLVSVTHICIPSIMYQRMVKGVGRIRT